MLSSNSILATLIALISSILIFFPGGGSSTPGPSPDPTPTETTAATTTPSEPAPTETSTTKPRPTTKPIPTDSDTTTSETTTTPTDADTETTEPTEPTETETTEPTPDPVGKINYVGLGDSYAAMGSQNWWDLESLNCYRSQDNYAHVLLDDEDIEGTDVSCSGAEIRHLTGPQEKEPDNFHDEPVTIPAQLNAVSADTDLISLTIGANDIGYWEVFECFGTAMQTPGESDCATGLADEIDAGLDALPAQLDAAYNAIKAQAPNAQIITAGYMPLMVEASQCEELTFISSEDQAWIIDLTEELNDTVKQAAEKNGASFAMPAEAYEHTGCVLPESERWVDFSGEQTGAFAMHPTKAGHAAMAGAIKDQLK